MIDSFFRNDCSLHGNLYIFKTMDNFIENNDTSTTDEFTCDICGEKFDSVSELEDHKLRHGRPGLSLDDEESEIRGDIGAAGLPTSPLP